MKVKELMKTMGMSKKDIDLSHVLNVKLYYMSMYRAYMVKLYDEGYISDPTRLDKVQIYQNIVDMDIKGMFGNSGKISLKSGQVMFAYYKNKENTSDAQRFLELLYYALLYREGSFDIDKFYEDQGIEMDQKKVKMRLNLQIKGASVSVKSPYPVGLPVLSCMQKFEYKVVAEEMNEYIWSMAMKTLEIPEEDWKSDGILDGSLTHTEELDCIKGLLGGDFQISEGKYTDKFINWLYDHKWGRARTVEESCSLYDYIFYGYVEETLQAYGEKMDELVADGKDVFAVADNCIYYREKRTSVSLPVGEFAVVCDSNCVEYFLPTGNGIYGYTGELYTRERLQEDGVQYAGCPIVLNTAPKERGIFYDLEQTDIRGESWFESEKGVDIVFGEDSVFRYRLPRVVSPMLKGILDGYRNALMSVDNIVYDLEVATEKSDVGEAVASEKELEKALNSAFKVIEESLV